MRYIGQRIKIKDLGVQIESEREKSRIQKAELE